MSNYSDILGKQTPQREPISERQVKNSAGGYVFLGDEWMTLDRFLIMGVTGNTFYANRKDIVTSNVKDLIKCILSDGKRYVDRIAQISAENRAIKQDSIIFALALSQKHGDLATRQYSYTMTPTICNTFPKLAKLLNERKGLGLGWSRGLRRAIFDWYDGKGLRYLIYQGLKYPNRHGWSQRIVIKMSHISSADPARQLVYDWLWAKPDEAPEGKKTKGELAEELWRMYNFSQAYARDLLFSVPSVAQAVKGIAGESLTHEMIPTNLLTNAEVWNALSVDMPYSATVRNLNKLSSLGVIDPIAGNDMITERLTNKTGVMMSRIHPVNLLIARKTYQQGRGERGSLVWTPSPKVVDALEDAVYSAIKSWPSMGKSLLIGVDISRSMTDKRISDDIPFTPAEMAGMLACVLTHIEPNSTVMGFTHRFEQIQITAKTSLNEAMREAQSYTNMMGATDCAMPMMYALGFDTNQRVVRGRIEIGEYIKTDRSPLFVDAFVILTDNETWVGRTHPQEAISEYRRRINPNAKLVVVTMQPNQYSITIADPSDKLSLDIVGFDSNVAQLLQEFVSNG